MPLPFYVKPSPAPTSKPVQQKTSTFGYLFKKSSITPVQPKKAIIQNKPGFLERGGFRTHDQLIHEIRKSNYYKSIPNYSKKFGQAERMKLVKELEVAGRGIGGLTGEKLGWAIKKLEKQKREIKSHARSHLDFEKVKTLDQKVKQAQVWQKTWDRQKK